ncbi:MAG: tail fiber domain-containing protein [Candidatus Binataceae bacterium]
MVNSSGRLGVTVSSARYKHDIRDMGGKSSALLKLRPVSFRYNNDPANTLQYGLVAEEVAKLYPQLLVHGPDGKVQTVRYSMLSAMLLNELQKQNRQLQQVSEQAARETASNVTLRDEVRQEFSPFSSALTSGINNHVWTVRYGWRRCGLNPGQSALEFRVTTLFWQSEQSFNEIKPYRGAGRVFLAGCRKRIFTACPLSLISPGGREDSGRKPGFMQGVENGRHSKSIDLIFSTPC